MTNPPPDVPQPPDEPNQPQQPPRHYPQPEGYPQSEGYPQPAQSGGPMMPSEPEPKNPSKMKRFVSLIVSIIVFLIAAVIVHQLKDSWAGRGVTEEEYTKGLHQIIAPALPADAPKELIDEAVNCLADRTYDRVSGVTKRNVANGEDLIAEKDTDLFSSISEQCGREASEKFLGGN